MSKYHSFYDTVDQIVTYGIEKGILHLSTGEQMLEGTEFFINGKKVINFGSCSYLGLEFDTRIKAAAQAAIDRYGTQFSASRAYISLGLYKKLQSLLEKIFDAHCVITPTTTLGHIAAIPVLVDDEAAVIMDQQVHNSVQTAVQIVKARGVHIELLRHNRMDLLETRIQDLRSKHKKIWYMADGIYSMFGDSAPVDHIYSLISQYPELHFYADDAHGMSIHGKHGRGFVLSGHDIHPKMVMATSLNKAFASGGGVLVFADKELARRVGTVGGPLLSSGPMQPSALGAGIAAAQIHCSDEIICMQEQLKDNIKFTRLMLAKYKLPVISEAGAAIFFVGVSLPKLGHNLIKRMLDGGFYLNLGVFPTVPMKQTGLRFTITRLHSFFEIEKMIATLAGVFPLAMEEENITLNQIYKAFKIPMPEAAQLDNSVERGIRQSLSLKLEHHKTIREVVKIEWNTLFKDKGTFDWEGMQVLENSFSNNKRPEDNWTFDYLFVRDLAGTIIVATFLTTALWKDDMLSPGAISRQIEHQRKNDSYYLTSKVICTGSLITEGEHLYINTSAPLWKDALQLLIQKIYSLQDLYKANHIMLRDFHGLHESLDDLMVDNGFFKVSMPPTHSLILSSYNPLEFHQSLSYKSRQHLQRNVLRNVSKFKIEIVPGTFSEKEIAQFYQLYLNVKNKNLELNTFALPMELFFQLSLDENWEVIRLTLNNSETGTITRPCCMVYCYKGFSTYMPMIIGLDYTYNQQFGIYRQALYQVVTRAQQLQKEKILMGFSASVEKQKFGAKAISTFAYMHIDDSYNTEALSTISLPGKSVPQDGS